ncbi:MAG TPA: phosphohistidine phosphatase SixA [Vicinamibacterales bacterium]|nr:phosphohistidine phosphatase SixA [Vicinamibacterales bacterium]
MAAPRTLYLIRHAIAHERGPKWPDDTKRPLTRAGIAKMRRAAKGLVAAGVKVDLVLSSPLVRARQTAEIVAAAFKRPPKIVEASELAPDQSAEAVVELLARQKRGRAFALVGHEPDLGQLAAWLVGAARPFPFKKGGTARIDVDDQPVQGGGQLVWLATPGLLRKIRST